MLTEDSSASPPPEPWRSFLKELDELLKGPVELRCLGGFVITQQYGIGRETSDIDYLTLAALSRDDSRSARGTRIKAASQIPRIYAVRGNRYASCRLRESTHPHVPISPMESPEAPCTGCHRPRPFQIGGASHIRSSGAEPSDGGLRSAALSNASSIRRAGHPCSRSIRAPGRADRRTGAAGKRGMKTAGPCSGRGK